MERRGAARGGRSTFILRSLVVRQKGRRFYNEIKICNIYHLPVGTSAGIYNMGTSSPPSPLKTCRQRGFHGLTNPLYPFKSTSRFTQSFLVRLT